MGRRFRFDKIILVCNVLAIFLLLASCFVPFVQSKYFSFLSFLGLMVPLLVVANILCMLYWIFRRNLKWLASAVFLCIAYFNLNTFFTLNFSTEKEVSDLKVMTYNVRSFNKWEELPSKTVLEDIKAFIKKENPDILCFQEPFSNNDYDSSDEFKDFPYRYLEFVHLEGKGLLSIFSKYPILKKGFLNLPRTTSNGIFTDIHYENDTIRIYNVHLESLGITPGQGVFRKDPADKLFKQVSNAFHKQFEQAQVIERHIEDAPHKVILCGDLNNGQYSNVYRTIRGDLQDTFLEAGNGYGHTYSFHGLPFRIDFIFADKSFEVKSHINYRVKYSDHYPVMASFELGGE